MGSYEQVTLFSRLACNRFQHLANMTVDIIKLPWILFIPFPICSFSQYNHKQ
jgi:hypothetical protein